MTFLNFILKIFKIYIYFIIIFTISKNVVYAQVENYDVSVTSESPILAEKISSTTVSDNVADKDIIQNLDQKIQPINQLNDINVNSVNPLFEPITPMVTVTSPSSLTKIKNTKFQFNSKSIFKSEILRKSLYNFELITTLYDQSLWNITEISTVVDNEECVRDMRIFLDGLSREKLWALQASDSSGRYRGQFFFRNDYWVGSPRFCREINYVRDNLRRTRFSLIHNAVQPTFGFFLARIYVQMDPKLRRDHAIQLGQCLPVSCTPNDVHQILEIDPIVKLFRKKKFAKDSQTIATNVVNMMEVRRIPGEYVLWNDLRIIVLLLPALIVIIIVICGTIYENIIRIKPIPEVSPRPSMEHTPNTPRTRNIELQPMESMEPANRSSETVYYPVTRQNENDEITAETRRYLKEGITLKIFSCFDFIENAKCILNVTKISEDSISCIHGLRVFSLLWTMLVHTYIQFYNVTENKFTRKIIERAYTFQIIANATFSVDTFFFISGLLVTLLFVRHSTTERKPRERVRSDKPSGNFLKRIIGIILNDLKRIGCLILYRYIRLTPAYFMVLIINELSMKYFFNESVFHPEVVDHLTCPYHWWRNLLYIQTLFPFSQVCMVWSWYLANDMQFYVLGVCLLIISKRFFKTSVVLLICVLISSWCTTAYVSVSYNYKYRLENPLDSFGFLYDQAWLRIGPFIVGMITAYIIHINKEPPKIPPLYSMLLWLVSLILLLILVFSNVTGELNVPTTATFMSLSHSAWGIAIMWITLSCKWGYSNFINKFLSYPGFIPLSRLTYCTYLIHPIIQIATAYHMEGTFHLQNLTLLQIFLGNAVLSYFCAFFFSIIFETPLIKLLKLILKR